MLTEVLKEFKSENRKLSAVHHLTLRNISQVVLGPTDGCLSHLYSPGDTVSLSP